ncbi:MAG: prolyl oligopeptidase family serine peptidase [Chryseolinea sp.]
MNYELVFHRPTWFFKKLLKSSFALRCVLLILTNILCIGSVAQTTLDKLTVDKIMRNPKWMGTAPTSPFWSADSKTLYFSWNPENAVGDSLYYLTANALTPKKVSIAARKSLVARTIQYSTSYTKATYESHGDIFFLDIPSKKLTQVTNTTASELAPKFSSDDKEIIFSSGLNLFSWDIATGAFSQITDFRNGVKPAPALTEQDKWLRKDQLTYFKVLIERNTKQEQRKKNLEAETSTRAKEIYIEDKSVQSVQLSPDKKFVTFKLSRKSTSKTTIVPNYVTTSGFTEDISSRTKVGAPQSPTDFFIYDIVHDTTFQVKLDDVPGIQDTLDYLTDYRAQKEKASKKRDVEVTSALWSVDGTRCVVSIASLDFKDRWIMMLDPITRKLTLLYREHDNAWINSPISDFFGNDNVGWLEDNKRIWFASEESGYSHLYALDVSSHAKTALTSGNFEVQRVVLSRNKQSFYIITNEANAGEKQLYKLSVATMKMDRLTSMSGAYEFALSPDEKQIALRYSYSNKPWELYLQENKSGANAKQVTHSLTEEFKSYPWRDPEIITFEARDKAIVYARIFKPAKANGAAVIFVHGAGYLQNAHKWWSSYFREYMFHNLLTDLGYTVLDIDYRASAGYGRDWRTGIYRFMGGKDLTDNLDGAKLLVDKYNVDPKRIAIYGGSYGGFITLMAMFTSPDTFAAGAALRPVTDWAHYNHPYTGAILNTPYLDSLSYAKSSPLYYAEGLKGALLICHGMVDTNVHYQDAVRLAQRLIELGKDNWELAGYPVEDHAFVEPSSWTDEYKRILKLFEQNLKPK